MRTAFINALMGIADRDKRIFLLCGDLGYSVLEPFAQKFPDRFINVGIAEQNMTGIAVGLAFEGYTVFTYSIGNFPTLRAMEQIRYDVCYHNANVKIVAVGGGFAYGPLGPSHHATEEMGMLRILPNLSVCAPGDPFETTMITELISQISTPCYLRLGKAGEPNIHKNDIHFEWGEMIPVISGKNKLIISTGSMLSYAHSFILENNLPWSLWSAPFVKPIDHSMLIKASKTYENIITIEEHQAMGGFGSAVLETLNDLREQELISFIPHVKRVAIKDQFLNVAGSQAYLRGIAGLTLTI